MKGAQRIVRATDGLRARDNGAWGEVKLSFLDFFCAPALKATASMPTRVFLDLFAGPGMNVDVKGGGREFEGSTLRALRACAPDGSCAFTKVVAVNAVGLDHRALEERVARLLAAGQSRLRPDQIELVRGDANAELPRILGTIHPRAYIFAFADIEAPRQWPWSSVEALRAHHHRSVDLYALFPLEMALNRLFSYAETHKRRYAHILTRFFGSEEWRKIDERRITKAQSPDLRRALEQLYLRRLREHWRYVESAVEVKRRGGHFLYKMIFASNHDAGKRIAAWAKRATRRANSGGQGSLFDP